MYLNIYRPEILDFSIQRLEFSCQFKNVCLKLEFENLSQVLSFRAYELLKLEGFDVRMLHEFIVFLENRGLAHLVRD